MFVFRCSQPELYTCLGCFYFNGFNHTFDSDNICHSTVDCSNTCKNKYPLGISRFVDMDPMFVEPTAITSLFGDEED